MKAIKIKGGNSEFLSVDLEDILSCVKDGEEVNWGLLWIEATVKIDSELSFIHRDYEINKSKTATSITWEELGKLSSQINQAIDLVIIGDKNQSNVKRYATEDAMYINCDYTIELVDSSYWIVHSNNDFFIKNIFEKLKGVEYYNVMN